MPISRLNSEAYLHKRSILDQGTARLRQNIELLHQCCQTFASSVETVIFLLCQYRDQTLQKLQEETAQLSESIEKAADETATCLAEGSLPVSPLAQALWAMPPEDMHVFSYTLACPQVNTETWVTWQNSLLSLCEQFHSNPQALFEEAKLAQGLPLDLLDAPIQSVPQPLVYISATQVSKFDSFRETWSSSTLNSPISVDNSSRWMWTGAELFCCGGEGADWTGSTAAYLLFAGREWRVQALADMITPRSLHALWWDSRRSTAVVFGGMIHAGVCKCKTDNRIFNSDGAH